MNAAMAFDAGRGRTVLFAGIDRSANYLDHTFEYDGTSWTRVPTVNGPSVREGHAMVFDPVGGRILLFGGLRQPSNTFLGDTWQYRGGRWTQLAPATSPPPTIGHGMTFDSARGRIVMFGGSANSTVWHGGTWEFEGTTWTQVLTANQPPFRSGAAMAFHAGRGRTILFGGQGAGFLADTWEYDGVNWHSVSTTSAPAPRGYSPMVYDSVRNRLVLVGGMTHNYAALGDTWEFDGQQWAPSPAPAVTVRAQHVLAYDSNRARTVCLSSPAPWQTSPDGSLSETQEFDGSQWTTVASAGSPPTRWRHDMVHDLARDRIVMFGGERTTAAGTSLLGDTWEFAGNRWLQVTTNGPTPAARQGHAMVYDRQRRCIVLFGGNANGMLADTWTFDGVNWQQVPTPSAPPARWHHDMAYDAARSRLVLFGGHDGSNTLADTWEFNGQVWQQASPAASPPALSNHAMTYDVSRGRTVLFGGANSTGAEPRETWEYTGSTWLQVSAPVSNVPSIGRSITYDAERAVVRMLQGWTTFQYSGSAWAHTNYDSGPYQRTDEAVAYSLSRGSTVMFGGGYSGVLQFNDTWEFVPADEATFARYGTGCPGSAGVPQLDRLGNGGPMLGNTFTLRASSLPFAGGFAVFGFGTELVQWGGSPLPIALWPFGLPAGCNLWIGPDVQMLVPASSIASLTVTVPAIPALAGQRIGAQVLSLDPSTPSGLGAVSNGAILRLR